MKEKKVIFCIKIIDREALLILYILGKTVAFFIFIFIFYRYFETKKGESNKTRWEYVLQEEGSLPLTIGTKDNGGGKNLIAA
jgi:hypothetical protein